MESQTPPPNTRKISGQNFTFSRFVRIFFRRAYCTPNTCNKCRSYLLRHTQGEPTSENTYNLLVINCIQEKFQALQNNQLLINFGSSAPLQAGFQMNLIGYNKYFFEYKSKTVLKLYMMTAVHSILGQACSRLLEFDIE